jgi:predicted RNase H-like HicB family nuclease
MDDNLICWNRGLPSEPGIAKNGKEHHMKLKVIVHPAEEGGFWAEVPCLRGCFTEGDTVEQTLANIREAAEGWLDVAAEQAEGADRGQVMETEEDLS